MLVLYYGFRDKRTGLWAKLTALLAVVYLISPIDLIPDFIPFFGWLDDLILVPLLLNLAIRLLPEIVRKESMVKANRSQKKFQFLISVIIILFIAFLLGIFFLIRHLINMK